MSNRNLWLGLLAAVLTVGIPLAASAAIAVNYTYDSQGRVHQAVYANGSTTRISKTGSPP